MTRIKLVLTYMTMFLLISLTVALIAYYVPDKFLANKENAFIFGLISSIFVGLMTGTVGYLSNKYLDRAILRIEHVDFKSERHSFKIDSEIWWIITHSGFVEYIDNKVTWPVDCFNKNEFSYYHLHDMKDIVQERILTYEATSSWTASLLDKVETYKEKQSDDLKNELIESFLADIVKFEEHYRETTKKSLVQDLSDKPVEASNFILAEVHGLLARHNKELDSYKSLFMWIEKSLKQGENKPKEIDHNANYVPKINCLIGVSNVGRTPALLKFESNLVVNKKVIPLRMTSKYNYYAHIDPNKAVPLKFEVDQAKCSFVDNKELFKNLTNKTNEIKCSLQIFLADGTMLEKSKIQLIDDDNLQI